MWRDEGHVAKSCEVLDAPLAESTNTAAGFRGHLQWTKTDLTLLFNLLSVLNIDLRSLCKKKLNFYESYF